MQRYLLGVDIGTTTMSASVFSADSGALCTSLSAATAPQGYDRTSADQILSQITLLIDELLCAYPGVCAIGVTGQMHGVVCLDSSGQAVTPLYTWQDQRADEALCREILVQTGHRVFPGYGHATLCALSRADLLPGSAAQYCTIADALVMRITGRKTPLMHASNAASLGLYNIAQSAFDRRALYALLPARLAVPETTAENRIAGYYQGIPVSVAIGDNQASFLGSVCDDTCTMLVNYGTGSQLSIACDTPQPCPGGELRPYIGGKTLQCFSALCGGRAYALLEAFFSAYMRQAGCAAASQYETMNALARQAYDAGRRLSVCTQFCGTREIPALRGSIQGVGEENFTPDALILGVLEGMVHELAAHFDRARWPQITQLVASGNAVQKNPMLQRLLADGFSLPVSLTRGREEASFGAALFGGLCAGCIDEGAAKSLIIYRDADA